MDPIRKIDDPRITAYAFGELEGDERAAVERFLESNPAARDEVDALRALGDTLRDELAAESAPSLSAAQHDAIRAAAAESAPDDGASAGSAATTARVPRARPVFRYAAAAAVLLLAGAALFKPSLLFGEGEMGLFGYQLFGGERVGVSTPDDEVASHFETRAAKRGEGSRLRQLGYSREGEADPEGREDLRALGYFGNGPGTTPKAKDIEALGYLGRPAEARSAEALAPESTVRYLQSAPLPHTSTAGTVLLSNRRGAAPEAPAASPPAASGPNAGLVFDDGGDQVLAAESKDFFEEAPPASSENSSTPTSERLSQLAYLDADDAEPASAPLAYPLPDSQREAWFRSGVGRRHAANESYAAIHDNPFVTVVPGDPRTRLSTFGVDVDRASYANVRRFLQRNELPPADAVRLEELVNAFAYADAAPASDSEVPFAVHVSSAAAPWAPDHRLVRVALKGRVIEQAERPAAQLTFLVDVSGSMQSADKLPLLKQSLRLLVEQLDARDHVALVTYASGSRVVLPSTPASEKATILAALDSLTAGGSTHGSAGLQLAYETAEAAALDDGERGTRRVLLCTDGDFNVGVTSQQGLHDLIAKKAEGGTFLTVLGFGTGNYKDTTAETLADRGNGQYAYIDGLDEAHHVLVRQLTGTLVTIAQDVKLQLEFNPAHARAWRQLGYENRQMAAQDFRNDRKDAGEIGAGHSVVAYYEVVPTGVPLLTGTAELKYDTPVETPAPDADANPELLTVNLRWKQPGSAPDDPADEFSHAFVDGGANFAAASDDFRFGAAVLAWGMALRGSPHRGDLPLSAVAEMARKSRGPDPDAERAKFVDLVLRAMGLLPSVSAGADLETRLRRLGYFGPGAEDGYTDEQRQQLCELGYIDCR